MSAPNNNTTNPKQQFVGAPQYYVQSGPVYNQQPGGVPIYQPQQVPVFYPQQGQQAYAGSFQTPVYQQSQQPQQQPQVVFIQQRNEQNVPLISNAENPWKETCELPVKQRLLNRHYEMCLSKWWNEAWQLYTEHWIACVLFTILYLGVSFIPYVGGFITLGMAPGYFIAGVHAIRPNGPGWKWQALFHGFYYYFPMLFIGILYCLAVAVGMLLIIPGFYFMVVLSFSSYVFLEYRCEGLGIIDSMTVSRKLLTRNFCYTFWIFIVVLFLICFGAFLFLVGSLITLPFSSFILVFAFRDIFGLSEIKQLDHGCVCC